MDGGARAGLRRHATVERPSSGRPRAFRVPRRRGVRRALEARSLGEIAARSRGATRAVAWRWPRTATSFGCSSRTSPGARSTLPAHDHRHRGRLRRQPRRGGSPHVLLVNDTGGLDRFGRLARHRHGRRRRSPTKPARNLQATAWIWAPSTGSPPTRSASPGSRTFYLQARAGDELVTRRRREGTGAAARRLRPRAARRRSNSRPAPGPGEEAMALEEPFEPRWRAGSLSIGFDQDRDLFLLEIEEFQPDGRGRRPAVAPARMTPRPCDCSPPASRCSRCPATAPRSPNAAGPRASSAATRSTRKGTRVPR